MKKAMLIIGGFLISYMGIGCNRFEKPIIADENYSMEYLLRHGWLEFGHQEYSAALELFTKACEKDSFQIEASVGLGWTLLMMDQGNLDTCEQLFQKGIQSAMWKSDARCGLVVVRFLQEQYSEIENLVDLILVDNADYFFQYNPSIDWRDLMLIKAQSYFYTDEYEKSWDAITEITDVFHLDPNDHHTWKVDNQTYFSFEAALAKVIEILSELYKDY
jgi:hypothetical protein